MFHKTEQVHAIPRASLQQVTEFSGPSGKPSRANFSKAENDTPSPTPLRQSASRRGVGWERAGVHYH